ncbi:MAG: hypothetical protein IAE95_11235 [Chitinophagaceae bacterium]|nr:hypothetical protein [Chitinophagaceae bacterium]
MKKLRYIIVLAFAVSGITSCKKDYTCTCAITSVATGKSSKSTVEIRNEKKSSAAAACRSREQNIIGYKTSCTIN